MPTTHLTLEGMTCRSCEIRVTRRLMQLDGVRSVDVSARTGIAEIHSSHRVPRADLVAAVERAGYAVADDDPTRRRAPWLTRDRTVWRDVGLTVAVLALILLVLRVADVRGLGGLADGVGASAGSGGLLVVVLIGLTAGFSTCMALVGGLVLAVSAAHARGTMQLGTGARIRPHLAFNLGRIVGFGALGALLGALGSIVSLSGRPLALLMIAVALVMGAIGLRLTQLSPRLGDGPGFTLPPRLALALRLDDRAEDSSRGYGDLRTAGLGAASFLLPCGFTQAVQVYAVSTGSPWRAAAVMALFALGTTPGLLALGGLTAGLRGRAARPAFRAAGVAVLGFAAINITAALGILTPGLGDLVGPAAEAPTTASANVRVDGSEQVLSTTQDLDGYSPAEATVYAGMPVRWQIETTSMGCASYLDADSLGLEKVMLEYGPNELLITAKEPGTYRYSCAMGMFHGVVHVVPRPGATA